jgi:transcriptional regulator with XRE-family HTH domain
MSPTYETLKSARLRAGLTQAEAAALVYRTLSIWSKWETGRRPIDRAAFELFCLKTNAG